MKLVFTIIIGLLTIGCGKNEPSMSWPIGEVVERQVGKEGFTKGNLAKVESLILGRTILGKDVYDLSPLESLPNLWMLSLSRQQKINDFAPLAKLSKLGQLDLSGCGISDLKPLAGLKNLTQLRLSQNKIADLSPLTGLTKLNHLTLTDNKLTNEQLAHLSKLENLKFLSIGNNPFSANTNRITSLEPLLGLKKLDEVILMNIEGLPDEEIDKLRKALPSCTIRR
jgi:Leucine-rich repeat (LRR) protein